LLAVQQRLRRVLASAVPGLLCAAVSLRELAVLWPQADVDRQPDGLRALLDKLQLRLVDVAGGPVRLALGGHERAALCWPSARATLQAGRRHRPQDVVLCYDELTLPVLLSGLGEGWRAEELQRPLRRMAEHDREGQLRRTLATWFAHDMKAVPSAAALHVHRNTLDYRLRKVGELTGLDLSRLGDCLLLFIGLELDRSMSL